MSHAGVGTAVEKLLTDENLRVRFALVRIETVAELCLRGELTPDEIDARCVLMRTPRGFRRVYVGRDGRYPQI